MGSYVYCGISFSFRRIILLPLGSAVRFCLFLFVFLVPGEVSSTKEEEVERLEYCCRDFDSYTVRFLPIGQFEILQVRKEVPTIPYRLPSRAYERITMAPMQRRAPAQPSITALATVSTGIGVVILCLIIVLGFLIIRVRGMHKQFLADADKRGVALAQATQKPKREKVIRPRAVLRRKAILPFNGVSKWGTLPSVETITSAQPPSTPLHYAPPRPAGFAGKPKRLSWPFSARRDSGSAINLRKTRVSTLPTVIESPRPSSLGPVLSGPLRDKNAVFKRSRNRPMSDQSLFTHHPAFRKIEEETKLESSTTTLELPRRSLTAVPEAKTVTRVRPSRSKSLPEIPLGAKDTITSRLPHPTLRKMSASVCSQSSGTAPASALPPLPLEIGRIKAEARRPSLLSRSPSRVSVSSVESAGTSILTTHLSAILSCSSTVRISNVSRRERRSSLIMGPRPLRDTSTGHQRNQRSQSSIKSSVARLSSAGSSGQQETEVGKQDTSRIDSSATESVDEAKVAGSGILSKAISPSCSPLTMRSLSMPKRKAGSYVTPYGSPEERRKLSSLLESTPTNKSTPKRQLSQDSTRPSSTRSSNGNPFQWDPAPISAGKPSALKSSPSARKSHGRKNCVRISLIPTFLGQPSRSPSPSPMDGIQEKFPNVTAVQNTHGGLGFSSIRALPRPPTDSVFAPDLKITATTIRASLTPSSPTLSMANYDHSAIGLPVISQARNGQFGYQKKRYSTGSLLSIPTFGSPVHEIRPAEITSSPPPNLALVRPSCKHSNDKDLDTGAGASSSFERLLDICATPGKSFLTDENGPEQPHFVFGSPTSDSTQNFLSTFSTILEESPMYKRLQSEDSPHCSPKTIPPGMTSITAKEGLAHNLPIYETAIPEEPLDTIDPALLSKDTLFTLNSGLSHSGCTVMKSTNSSRSSPPIPNSPSSAKSMFEPMLEGPFPSSPPVVNDTENGDQESHLESRLESSPTFIYSSPGSLYSARSPPSPTPLPPSSPRPCHAQLPVPSLNSAALPTLSPSLVSGSPTRPLRSSIQKLRRMNSDAEKRQGRGEHRYLRLGRESSVTLPGGESWIDGLKNGGSGGGMGEGGQCCCDEERGTRLVAESLDDWEEGGGMLNDVVEGGKESTQEQNEVATTRKEIAERRCLLLTPSNPSPLPAATKPEDENRSSSIWEDREKLWHSAPPHPHPLNSPNKPTQRFQSPSSSPCSTPAPKTSASHKRGFEVAKDEDTGSQLNTNNSKSHNNGSNGKDSSNNGNKLNNRGGGGGTRHKSLVGNPYRKRSVLGIGTPNVRIQVQPPSDGAVGTPGSLYDEDGFLRV